MTDPTLRGQAPECFPVCGRRRDQTFVDQDGTRIPESRCGHMECESAGQAVTPDYCSECPLRQEIVPIADTRQLQQITVRSFKQPKLLADGTLVYEKTGWERPVPPAGYKAKSNDRDSPDAWVLVPIWPRCVDRKFSNNMKPCGCVNVVQVCNSREASTYLQIVTPDVCEQCPLRRTQP